MNQTVEKGYYEPELEEQFFGYECEREILDFSTTGPSNLGFKKYVIGQEVDMSVGLRERREVHLYFKDLHMLRTPYLTNQQIGKEGKWSEGIYRGAEVKFTMHFDGSGWYELTHNEERHHVMIEVVRKKGEIRTVLYNAECKSINELRKIMKWLNIG